MAARVIRSLQLSQFEFVLVIASIVVALSLTRLFDGLGQILQKKMTGKSIDATHAAFSLFLTALLLVIWWSLFRWDQESDWNFLKYLTITLYMASFYALASILYPRNAEEPPRFLEVRRSFYLALLANSLLEIFNQYLLGDLFSPWYYLPITCHMTILYFIGFNVDNRKFNFAISIWSSTIIILYPFFARFTV